MILALLLFDIHAQQGRAVFYMNEGTTWVDSVMTTLDTDGKLGQLFMVAAYSNKGEKHLSEIKELVTKQGVGGLIFFQGGPYRQARITNELQNISRVPLLIGMDAEWDLSMRLDSTFKFPWQMTMGAVNDSLLLYQTGRLMGRHAKRLGVHVTFSPVVDLNTNPDNPIINARAFGEDPDRVAFQATALMRGIQDEGVLACAKHFPGHGDTDSDSHKTLPTVSHDIQRFREVEWAPYNQMIKNGLGSIMVAHLNVPALDTSGMPSSLSPKVVNGYLRNELGFDGLTFTDALNMKGVSARYEPGEVDLKALLAGNDIMLFAQDVSKAKGLMKKAIKDSLITMEEIDRRVRKILMAKYWAGLSKEEPISLKGLAADLNDPQSEVVRRKIFEKGITVLINRDKTLPIKEVGDLKIAYVGIGREPRSDFYRTLRLYADVQDFVYEPRNENQLLAQLSDFDRVIVGYFTSDETPWKPYGMRPEEKRFIQKLGFQNHYILAVFANPYTLRNFKEIDQAKAVVMAYQSSKDAQELTAQMMFGAVRATGSLPVSISELFTPGYGLFTADLDRLRYGIPEEVGIDRRYLVSVDRIAMEAMRDKATPGMQILIARKGKVIYHKAFGYQSTERRREVGLFDLYDLASITKITSTLPLVMDLYDQNRIDLDMPIGDYLPEAKGTNKADLSLRDILAHQAGLVPWIPFYLKTMKDHRLRKNLYSDQRSLEFPIQVAKDLYLRTDYPDSVYTELFTSPLGPSSYKYSDLGYYMLFKMVQEYYHQPIDQLVREKYYKPLGAYTMGFKPLDRFPDYEIIPTENDLLFRGQLLRGYVHDQGAALLGGVAGHAGLFSNANDLAKMMQMYLNGGHYGGIRFFDSTTVNEFTRCQFCDEDNRRGAGFDKPQLEGEGPTCGCVSLLSFGHTGFTGTIAWADPVEEVVYVFLSNRINPSAENKKLITGGYRTRIQEVIYEAIEKSKNNEP
ncbi:MAG: serine hydrolase, partial [Bacteroidota bacterium]|nr:serine hydrolase [Bacteroidota bacterium]